MKVIGTAGHIDHGKSTLVHRLTGIDPDRLEEEKRRGMTIDLGFAWLTLPSGAVVSVVDVPGHERFIKNMLAGSGGIDVALLVVAADESVMPQTREHLDILHLLGIRRGVVALTKRDLVENDWLELVTEDVVSLLRETTLDGSPIVPVSARTGQGLDELRQALDAAIATAPERVDRGFPFLPIDRVFTIAGFGTVVTGTLAAGPLQVGQEMEIVPGDVGARIRGLQVHGGSVEEAPPGTRVAVNLSGVDRLQLRRGDVLALPGTVAPITKFDAWLDVLPDAPFPLAHGVDVSMHLGAAERPAKLSLFGRKQLRPGDSDWVQLRFEEPVAAVRGQRFVLRLPAPARTVAGGAVVDVAPHHRRLDEIAVRRLEGLRSPDFAVAALAALSSERRLDARQLASRLAVSREAAQGLLDELVAEGAVVRLGDGYVHRQVWESLRKRAREMLATFHAAQPLAQGMSLEELRARLRVPRQDWGHVVQRLKAEGVVDEAGPVVLLAGHEGGLGTRRADAERVRAILRETPYSPLGGPELEARAGVEPALLRAMVDGGEIVRLTDGVYLDREAYDTAVSRVCELLQTAGEVTVAQVRDELKTSRKYALALLEYLDGQKITRRLGDVRVAGTKAQVCVSG